VARLNKAAEEARIAAYKGGLQQKLASNIIDVSKPDFTDLVTDKGKPMASLDGQVILKRDLREDGSLKGVIAVELDDLSTILPDVKADTEDKMGWRKHIDRWSAEGIDVLEGVADPQPGDYELPAAEELASLNVAGMSDAEAKQKLLELQQKRAQE